MSSVVAKLFSKKIRVSIVVTDSNYSFFEKNIQNIVNDIQNIGILKITIRPGVFSKKYLKGVMGCMGDFISSRGVDKYINGVWFYNTKITNSHVKTAILWPNDNITGQEEWDKIIEENK